MTPKDREAGGVRSVPGFAVFRFARFVSRGVPGFFVTDTFVFPLGELSMNLTGGFLGGCFAPSLFPDRDLAKRRASECGITHPTSARLRGSSEVRSLRSPGVASGIMAFSSLPTRVSSMSSLSRSTDSRRVCGVSPLCGRRLPIPGVSERGDYE